MIEHYQLLLARQLVNSGFLAYCLQSKQEVWDPKELGVWVWDWLLRCESQTQGVRVGVPASEFHLTDVLMDMAWPLKICFLRSCRLDFTWTFGKDNRVVAAKEGSSKSTETATTCTTRDNQVAGEQASQVVQENAETLALTTPAKKVQEPHPIHPLKIAGRFTRKDKRA